MNPLPSPNQSPNPDPNPCAVAVRVEGCEGVVRREAEALDAAAQIALQRALEEQRELVVEREELGERRLLPALREAAAARDVR